MIIRPMRPDEMDLTVILMEYYRDEANLPDGEYDGDAMVESIRNLCINADSCWFNMYDGTRPVGLVAGYVVQLPWSRKLIAHVQFIYMLQSHRNLSNAKQLVNKFEEWARSLGAVKLSAGDIGIDPERTRVFYEQVGFRETGCSLSKELVNE